MDLIKPSPPSHRKLERFIAFMILVLVVLAVPLIASTNLLLIASQAVATTCRPWTKVAI